MLWRGVVWCCVLLEKDGLFSDRSARYVRLRGLVKAKE